MTRPRLITIGWTRSDPDTGYSSFSDGYRRGAQQHTETLEINTELDPSEIAEAAYHATNAPEGFVESGSVADHIAKVLENRGFDGSQSGHYSLSVGDTVTVDGYMMACARTGWEVIEPPVPAWGLAHVVPATAVAAWGARLIVDQDGHTDFLFDRQGSDEGPHSQELLDLLNSRFHVGTMREILTSLLLTYDMNTRSGEDFILHVDDRLVVHANTNGSAGYCYVTAWLYPESTRLKGATA